MGQTAPRGSKSAEDLEGVQGVMVPQIPENADLDVQEPVFGSPIDSELTYYRSPYNYLPLYLTYISKPPATSVPCQVQR